MGLKRIPISDSETFRSSFLEKNEPVIITGAIDSWPAYKQWSFESLLSKVPKLSCVAGSDDILDGSDSKSAFSPYDYKYAHTSLENCIEGGELEKHIKVVTHPINTQSPLSASLGNLETLISGPPFTRNLFLWTKDHFSHFHYDPGENLMVQIKGSKSFRLAAPKYLSQFYNQSLFKGDPQFTSVNFRDASFEDFPKAREIEFIVDTLEAGEILYIPVGWFHEIKSLDTETFSVPHFYFPSLRKVLKHGLLKQIIISAMFRMKLLFSSQHLTAKKGQ